MIRYYFIGNTTNGPQLIKALEEKGGINVREYSGDTNAVYYCNPDNNEIYYVDKTSHLGKFIINTFEEIKLPLFKRGDRVLVRDRNSDCWKEAIYSFTHQLGKEVYYYYVLGGNDFYQCIPFDINKLGKVTNE